MQERGIWLEHCVQCSVRAIHDKYPNTKNIGLKTYGEDEVTLDDVSNEGEHGTVEMGRKE